jgi:hypothetical protein
MLKYRIWVVGRSWRKHLGQERREKEGELGEVEEVNKIVSR